jgi:hypothetical protein
LNYFDRLTNFFLNRYQNNLKYRHSLLSYLKLFFERNTKDNSTFASLGNVFRNSKWTDLKVQNVKTTFVKQFYLVFMSLLVLLFVKSTDSYFVLMDLYVVSSNLILNFIDLAAITYVLFMYLLFPFLFKPSSLVTYKNTSLIDLSNYTTQSTKTLNTEDYNLTRNLYKTTQLVNEFTHILLKNDDQRGKSSKLSLSNTALNYQPVSYSIDSLGSNKQLNISLLQLNKLLNNKYFLVSSSNFSKDLNLMKTDRWLLKNSLISEDLIRNTNAYTSTKKLIGSNVTSSQLSSRNVWASTNLNKVNSSNLNTFLTSTISGADKSLQLSHVNNSNLLNFNFFEESRLFTFNKYLHSNKTRLNTLVYSDGFTNLSPDTRPHNQPNPTFSLASRLFTGSLDYNLQPFLINTRNPLQPSNQVTNNFGTADLFLVNSNTSLLNGSNLNTLVDLTSPKGPVTWNSYL